MNLLGMVSAAALVKVASDAQVVNKAAAPYRSLIRRAADKHQVAESVLVGIFWRESRFNPAAVGSLGEIGLGQFLPIAAKDIGVSFDSLKADPAAQIDAAAKLLALNRSRAGGNIVTAIRAYNVGIGRAKSDGMAGLSYAADVLKNALGYYLVGLANGGNDNAV